MSLNVTRRLRSYLFSRYRRLQCPPHARSFSATLQSKDGKRDGTKDGKSHETNDYKRRVAQLEQAHGGSLEECYPLLDETITHRLSISEFHQRYEGLLQSRGAQEKDVLVVAGRVKSVRTAGNKLLFLDLQQGEHTLQIVCQFGKLDPSRMREASELKAFSRVVRKGDWYQVQGHPYRSDSGELSILASDLPKLLSPSLHQIPETLEDAETRAKNRHVEMLVNPAAIQTLIVRHMIDQHLNSFFTQDGFTKVHTPILASGAGGAVARPFETEATELEGQKLNLRIAPELWLKRLIVGGMEKVYEIGPAFRNEGVDATHNPEFYTCEFYEAFATLNDLIGKTERLLLSISEVIEAARSTRLPSLSPPHISFEGPFQRLAFFPTLESELGQRLPSLSDPATAQTSLLSLFQTKSLPIPSHPTLPRLLDALSAHYLEPLSRSLPTFITHHPAILSPLAKHTICPSTGQAISLRAELFIAAREYANMYEEENSPFHQRRKFQQQLAFREIDGEGDARGEVDEKYLQAMEWGLPPTGGWGCGIDRLVMLFAGRERIADVLSFGTLRNVVALGRTRGSGCGCERKGECDSRA